MMYVLLLHNLTVLGEIFSLKKNFALLGVSNSKPKEMSCSKTPRSKPVFKCFCLLEFESIEGNVDQPDTIE